MWIIYYAFGLIVLLGLTSLLIQFNLFYTVREWFFKFKKVTGRQAKKFDFRKKEDFNMFEKQNIILIIDWIWIILGFFTIYWKIFLLVSLASILTKYITKPIIYTISHKLIVLSLLISKIIIYGFIIIDYSINNMNFLKFFHNL